MGDSLSIRITATREIEDPRVEEALRNPFRRKYKARGFEPLDVRIESPLGRMLLDKRITEPEYNAGCQWRGIYADWLHSISCDPDDVSDAKAEATAKSFKSGVRVLKALGDRVFHAVNAVAVYEETEDLGDFEFTAEAARRGLHALTALFAEDPRSYEIIYREPVEERGLLDAPRLSGVALKGKSHSKGLRELVSELKLSDEKLILVDCEENAATGEIDIRRYDARGVRF